MSVQSFFPTLVYRGQVTAFAKLNSELVTESHQIEGADKAGQSWSKQNYKGGYTSYSSLSELHLMSSTFRKLQKHIDQHVKRYGESLDIDMKRQKLNMTNCWVNIARENVYHTMHMHPLSAISGTYYVQVPKGAGELKFEDPRFSMFMNAPAKIAKPRTANKHFVSFKPKAGELVLFESWLRHEVTPTHSSQERISVSFNYS